MEIEKNIPLPKGRKKHGETSKVVAKLEIGHSVWVPNSESPSSVYQAMVRLKMGGRMQNETKKGVKGVRLWRVK